MYRYLAILLLSIFGCIVDAQVNPLQGHGAPSGPCTAPYTDIDTGNFYTCKVGQFTLSSGLVPGSSITTTGVFTNTQVNGPYFTSLVNGANLLSDFQADFGHSGQFFTDAMGVGILVPGSSTVYESHGIFADINTASSTTAAVALKGMAICAVTGCRIWGLNTVANDGGFAPAFYYGYEDNVNVQNASSVGFGISLLGVWTAQPTRVTSAHGNFPGVTIQTPLLANLSGPSGNKWTAGFACEQAATDNSSGFGDCIDIAPNGSGNGQASQAIWFHARNSSGTGVNGGIEGGFDQNAHLALVPVQSTDYGATRLYTGYFGTAYSGADAAIVLGAGWGTTGAVSAATGFDQSFTFTVTPGGTGIAANPTLVTTFKDSGWGIGSSTAPGFTCNMVGGTGTFAFIGVSTTSTTLTATYEATPSTGLTYIITCQGVGR